MALHPRRIIGIVIVVAVLGAAGWGAWAVWRSRQGEEQSGVLVLFGNVDVREVELAFNASERIDRVDVEEGDRVAKGDLLASLDARRLQHAVDEAAGRAEAQRQVVARLTAGSRPEEIRKARADVGAADAEARNAERVYQRLETAVEQKAATWQELDDARGTRDAAAARLEAAKETLNLYLAGPREEDIASAEARLRADEAALALAQRKLADASLFAPRDGVIRTRIMEPGDMASPSRPVLTMALTDPVWVRAYVDEPDLGKIHAGLAATVHTDSFPDQAYDGWIGFISPTAEFTPKSVETADLRSSLVYEVRVYVRNPRNELRLGMPATVRIPLAPAPAPAPAPSPAAAESAAPGAGGASSE